MAIRVQNILLGFLAVILLLVFSFFNVIILADNGSENNVKVHQLSQYASEDYVVDKYDINIVVNENNTLDVVENIDVYFNNPKHGMIFGRSIESTFLKPDGSSVKYKSKMSNISVNDTFEKYKKDGKQYIKIGSSKKTVTGGKNYTIKYRYNIVRSGVTNVDQLYYNLVVSDHSEPYGDVTFSITMPKDFDSSKLGFTIGTKRSEDSAKVKYVVDGKKITGRYEGVLNSNEALTVRCELPKGYFTATDLDESFNNYVLVGISVLLLIIAILITVISLKQKPGPLVEPVEFYPPDNLNSSDIAYIYKSGNLEDKDVTSLLIYFANKGCINISQESDDDNDFKITKIKDYDGNNEGERLFFEGLFESGKNDVGYDDLYDKFYKVVGNVKKSVDKVNFSKIFTNSALLKFNLILLMAVIITVAVVGVNVYSEFDNLIHVVIGAVALFVVVIIFTPKFMLGIRVVVLLISWGFSAFLLIGNRTYWLANFVGFICVIIMILCAYLLPKRTEYGHNMLGRINGFKNFLITAEKDRLEALVMDDPQYFYNILPYTYVLGVSSKWIEKFDSITLKEPDWYNGSGMFDVFVFDRIMYSTMSSVAQSSQSSSSTSGWGSGSSGTGGGVAGGGYGDGSSSAW